MWSNVHVEPYMATENTEVILHDFNVHLDAMSLELCERSPNVQKLVDLSDIVMNKIYALHKCLKECCVHSGNISFSRACQHVTAKYPGYSTL